MADTLRFPFFVSKPAPLPGSEESSARFREKSAALAQRSAESFERCDTDGCISQWGDGLNAALAQERARIASDGGYARFACLFDTETGEPLRCARKPSKFGGSYWLLGDEEAEKYGRRFVPAGSRSRIQKQLGLREDWVWQPATARLTGTGTGLSGNVWVGVFPTSENDARN